MIKLYQSPKPIELTEEFVEIKTEEFKENKNSVWRTDFIRDALLKSSYNKCCFSETKLNEESKYSEIEHFYPKSIFPDRVLEWTNLLPSCKKCNGTKGELNTEENPIVNPYIDNPKEHLYIKSFRYYHLTQIGKDTINFTAINDHHHFVKKRSEISLYIIGELDDLLESLIDSIGLNNFRKITKSKNKFKSLLSNGNRKESYSAFISTSILEHDSYNEIVRVLNENNLWDEKLEEIVSELNFCAMPPPL